MKDMIFMSYLKVIFGNSLTDVNYQIAKYHFVDYQQKTISYS